MLAVMTSRIWEKKTGLWKASQGREAKGVFKDKEKISNQLRSERPLRLREGQEERPRGGNERPCVGGADGAGAQGCRLWSED